MSGCPQVYNYYSIVIFFIINISSIKFFIMKKLLALLLIIPFLSHGQVRPKWILTVGEYTTPAIDSIGRAVMFSANLALTGNGGAGIPGIALACSTPGTTFVSTGNTLHGSLYVDNTGHAWVAGDCDQGQCGLGEEIPSVGTLTKIPTDASGNEFVGIKLVQGFFYQSASMLAQGSYFVKKGVNEDTVFGCGQLSFGMNMNGTTGTRALRPYPIYWRQGHHIQEITAEKSGMLLFDDGTIAVWGGAGDYSTLGYHGSGTEYETPHLFSPFIPGEVIKHIAGGDLMGYVMIGTEVPLWGFGRYGGYLGDEENRSFTEPHDLTEGVSSHILNGTTRTSFTAVVGNSNCFHVLANDSTCWGWGDNGMGSIGNGDEPNMATIPYPWFVDPAQRLVHPQTHPVQVTHKHNFTNIYGGCLFTFLFFALDAEGQLYAAGRNKGTAVPNGVVSCENHGEFTANYPNSWDLPFLVPINPYGVTTPIPQGCPGCKTGVVTAYCSSCPIPSTTPVANAGPNQTINASTTTLDGSASTCTGGQLIHYLWTQVSGKPSTIDVPAAIRPNISGLKEGTYVYNLRVSDNGFNIASSNVTVTLSASSPGCPVSGKHIEYVKTVYSDSTYIITR